LIIPMIIQTVLLDLSGAVWTDEASNVSRLDPSGAVQVDAEHPPRNRKVVGLYHFRTPRRPFLDMQPHRQWQAPGSEALARLCSRARRKGSRGRATIAQPLNR
jgi:hypothetical protein